MGKGNGANRAVLSGRKNARRQSMSPISKVPQAKSKYHK